jgi:hypothetical protein
MMFGRYARRTLYFLLAILVILYIPLRGPLAVVDREVLPYLAVFVAACLLMWSDLRPALVELQSGRKGHKFHALDFVYDNIGANQPQTETISKRSVRYKDQFGDADVQMNTYYVGIKNNLPTTARNVSVVAYAVDGHPDQRINLLRPPAREKVDIQSNETEFFELGFALDDKRDAIIVEHMAPEQIRDMLREHIFEAFTLGSLGKTLQLSIVRAPTPESHAFNIAAYEDGMAVQNARFTVETDESGVKILFGGLLESKSG